MTRARVGIVAILAGLAIALGAAAPASADTMDDLIKVDDALTTAANTFIDTYSDQNASVDDVVAATDTFETAAKTAEGDYKSIADSASGEFAAYAKKFSGEAGDMAKAASGISDAITAEDTTALTKAETDFDSALQAYSSTADEYNKYLETAPEARMADPTFVVWLIVLIVAVVFLILTLIFALLTRKQEGLLPAKADKKGNIQQSSLKRLRWMVVLWAGLFVVGAAIPFFQVMFAQADSSGNYTYRIFWYPLAAGVILSIIGLVQYFVAAGKVRREGSAAAYDPNDPSTFGAAQGAGFSPVPPAEGYQPVPPGYEPHAAPVPPAPTQAADAAAPAAPVAEAPAVPAPAAPVADAPAAPAPTADTAAPAAAPDSPAAPAN
ncbi:hypothetical protein ACFVAE_08810 [Microbacterium sp. NPDC057659]|uniref:hypothetical protein n=1 Tax=Microbacterium sp. NPDC057659 TaxID=3346198 RepID=UPI00366DAA43